MNARHYQLIAREIMPGGVEYVRTIHTTTIAARHHAMVGLVTKTKNKVSCATRQARKARRLRIVAIASPRQWLRRSEAQRARCKEGAEFASVREAACAISVKPQAIYAAFHASRRQNPNNHAPTASVAGFLFEYIDDIPDSWSIINENAGEVI